MLSLSLDHHTISLTGCHSRLISYDANSSSLHSTEPDDDILRIVGHNLVEVALVNNLLPYITTAIYGFTKYLVFHAQTINHQFSLNNMN